MHAFAETAEIARFGVKRNIKKAILQYASYVRYQQSLGLCENLITDLLQL